MPLQIPTLTAFERRVCRVIAARAVVRWLTGWAVAAGLAFLVLRMSGSLSAEWLAAVFLSAIPVAAVAVWSAWRRRPSPNALRAAFDARNRCGGLVMASDAVGASDWLASLAHGEAPALRWDKSRPLALLAAALLFPAATLLVPERFATFSASQRLEIGQTADELNAQIEVLEEEKILEPEKAEEWKEQLARLEKEASGINPSKTWEALDHLKQATSEQARQAAEEALAKMESLTQAEALARAMEMVPPGGMKPDVLTRAMQDLASLLQAARLEEGLLDTKIPEELLQAAREGGLSKEQLENLLKSVLSNKQSMSATMARLAELKLISAEKLGKCEKAGQCPDPKALAAFLAECEGGDKDAICAAVAALCRGNGGINRGRGDAPMIWGDPSTETGARFKEETLPAMLNPADSTLAGLSRTAPQVNESDEASLPGALAGARAGGGSAQTQVLLPRHRAAVQKFFKREE